jgi:hypothetical protein
MSFCDKARIHNSRKEIKRNTAQEGKNRYKRTHEKGLRWSGISTVTCSTLLELPGVTTPADIAHGLIESRKPSHHDKVQSREGEDMQGRDAVVKKGKQERSDRYGNCNEWSKEGGGWKKRKDAWG